MKKFCILIPTKGHPQNIKWMISKVKKGLKRFDFDLIIGESDPKEESKVFVEEAKSEGFDNIKYIFFENDMESEMKVQELCKLGSRKYEYVMVCRDRNILDVEKFGNRLVGLFEKNYTIISLLTKDRTHLISNFRSKEYTDESLFFRDLYWNLTSWGNSIINNELALYFANQKRSIQGTDNSFFLIESMFTYFANNKTFRAYNLVDEVLLGTKQTTSSWKYKDIMLDIWAKAWCETIDRLPNVYNKYKRVVKKSRSKYFYNFVNVKHLFSSRADGDFSIKSVKRNKSYIPQMTNTSLFWFYVVALVPRKPLFYLKYYLKHEKRPQLN